MTMYLQQLAYQYEAEAAGMGKADDRTLETISSASQPRLQQQQQQQSSRQRGTLHQQRGEMLRSYSPEPCDHAVQQRESKMQLQQHEHDQHLHQLQSINNLLLNLPTSPTSGTYPNLKYSHDVASPTTKNAGSNNIENMSISDLFGLGLPRGSLMGAEQKEENGPTNFDAPAYRNNFQQQRVNSNGYYCKSNSLEQYDGNNCYYSNSSNTEVPSSPISINTPASPSTPGSLYSNPYSYSTVSSSPYNSASSVSSGYNKQFSSPSVRSSCYGRAIRGSPPYSDCESPSVEYSPRTFGCNGSRSDSPADSENSVNSADELAEIMNFLSNNAELYRYFVPDAKSLADVEKYFELVRPSLADLQSIKSAIMRNSSHQQQTPFCQSATPRVSRHNHSQQYNNSGPFNNNNNFKCTSKKNCYFESSECSTSPLPNPTHPPHWSLDKAVRSHRNAAASSCAKYTWSGTLPQRTQKPIGYSTKVFFGGVPWDITESNLISTFKQFGQIKIEWPGKGHDTNSIKGYVYVIFESEKQVKSLLSCCTHDFSNGGSYYFKISSKRMKGKQVQVIPWALNDSNYVKSSSQKLDPQKTVFVGALHGMISASGLARIMNDLFDNVIYAGIDTDKHKYPIGSARVTFWSKQSFNKAINAAFVDIKTPKFTKKVQIDPYIEDSPCSSCYVQQGPYFCREWSCFKYYCHTCWQWVHSNDSKFWHEPMSRGLKNQVIGLTPSAMMRRTPHLL